MMAKIIVPAGVSISDVRDDLVYPAWGAAWPKSKRIWLSNKLSGSRWSFALEHELYHLFDQSTVWIWREIKANIHAAITFPKGFVWHIAISVTSPVRLIRYVLKYAKIKEG